MKLELSVNGRKYNVDSEPERPLLEVLREDLSLTGTKYGCGEGQCRACTVLLDGRASISCTLPVKNVAGRKITTIEGVEQNGKLHRVQEAFIAEGAMQCGYCVPGLILRTMNLLETTPKPTRAQTIAALDGSLCRCGGYQNILAAVKRAAGGSRA